MLSSACVVVKSREGLTAGPDGEQDNIWSGQLQRQQMDASLYLVN